MADEQVQVYGGETRTVVPPMRFRVQGDPETGVDDSPVITVHEPDAGTVMDFLESSRAMDFRRSLRILLGPEQWAAAEEQIERLHISEIVSMTQDISRHFALDQALTGESSRQTRRARRARR